jgi:hypothetical protein
MNTKRAVTLTLGIISLAALSVAATPIRPDLLSGLVWRNVGPFRAGRISAVSGVIGEPGTFYFGLPAGGVWKTTNAGATWWPIFDSVKDASVIGAVEVAPSNGNTIYVGTGDLIAGDGNAAQAAGHDPDLAPIFATARSGDWFEGDGRGLEHEAAIRGDHPGRGQQSAGRGFRGQL